MALDSIAIIFLKINKCYIFWCKYLKKAEFGPIMTRIISTAEVKKHKHKDSVWIIIHDDVYDVSSFLEEVNNILIKYTS